MQQPKSTTINEGKATSILFHYLRKNKIQEFNYKELKIIVIKIYKKKFGGESSLVADKYYKYIWGHAIKILKKNKHIEKINDEFFQVKIKEPEPFEIISEERYDWETNNTISSIYEFIGNQKHLLPSFQRATAWKSVSDYKELAYSIFRAIPLGIMYMWEISAEEAIEMRHNSFKRDVIAKKELQFESFNRNEYKSNKILSVIDGQQRITGINVLVNGSFDGKKCFFNEYMQGLNKFSFKKDEEHFGWVKIEVIYNELKKIHKSKIKDKEINLALEKLKNKLYISKLSLKAFYESFFVVHLIAICIISKATLAGVLDVFIRTNKFGKKLSPADIVLSRLVGNNKEIQIKQKVEKILKLIRKYKNNFSFPSVLKLLVTYFTDNPKMDYNTFLDDNEELSKSMKDLNVNKEISWNKLIKSIEYTIVLLKEKNFNSKWINSDNSLIPIIYWHSRHWNRKITKKNTKTNILNYLLWSQLLKHFNSSTDEKIRNLIQAINNEDFKGWKVGTKSNESNVEELLQKLDEIDYSNSDDKSKAFIILDFNENVFDGSNSIEHLNSQNKNGSQKLWNLALLPKEINSELQDKPLRKKIDILMKRYNQSEQWIRKALWIPEDSKLIDMEKLQEQRKQLIKNAIKEYLN